MTLAEKYSQTIRRMQFRARANAGFKVEMPLHEMRDAIDCMLDVYDYCKSQAEIFNGSYTAHEVAEILADAFGDTCACNFNGNDEWLPEHCELLDCCPNTVGVACWEQYLKHLDKRGGKT